MLATPSHPPAPTSELLCPAAGIQPQGPVGLGPMLFFFQNISSFLLHEHLLGTAVVSLVVEEGPGAPDGGVCLRG